MSPSASAGPKREQPRPASPVREEAPAVDREPWIHPRLSPRESEIARLVARGHPNKTIAGILEISPWTVATHLRRMYAKLGVGSRAAMVARLLGGAPVLVRNPEEEEGRR